MKEPMTPDQLQWVLDHNMAIRVGHRVQIADAVVAWRAAEAKLSALSALEEDALKAAGMLVGLEGTEVNLHVLLDAQEILYRLADRLAALRS